MTNWWWVRHGPTHRKNFVGWSDVEADLSDTAALARLSAHLPDDAIVISSDLIRCVATADAIQADRTRLSHHQDLREFNFGDWELRDYADIAKDNADLSKEYWTNPGEAAPPNGESWNQVSKRVCDAVDAITKMHKGRHIIAVGHFGVILTQIQRAAKMPASSAIGFQIDNLSVTRVEHLGGTDWRVLGVNHKL
jgi:broad specificity phosphatase PhoE